MTDKPKRRRIRMPAVALVSAIWVLSAILACVFGPLLVHYNAIAPDVAHAYASPGTAHVLGTDGLGRDELARLLAGGRITLAVGAIAAAVAILIGTVYGALAGFYGGWIDTVLMRIIDVLMSVPTLFLLLFLAAVFAGSIPTLMLVIGLTSWLNTARLVRGEVLTLKERLFVEAARAVGADEMRVLFRHIVPNAFGTIVTTATFMVATAMLSETALSYLGIGVRAPMPSWGNLLSSAQTDIFAGAYWLLIPPGLAILLTVCALNFIGDWLRERREGNAA